MSNQYANPVNFFTGQVATSLRAPLSSVVPKTPADGVIKTVALTSVNAAGVVGNDVIRPSQLVGGQLVFDLTGDTSPVALSFPSAQQILSQFGGVSNNNTNSQQNGITNVSPQLRTGDVLYYTALRAVDNGTLGPLTITTSGVTGMTGADVNIGTGANFCQCVALVVLNDGATGAANGADARIQVVSSASF